MRGISLAEGKCLSGAVRTAAALPDQPLHRIMAGIAHRKPYDSQIVCAAHTAAGNEFKFVPPVANPKIASGPGSYPARWRFARSLRRDHLACAGAPFRTAARTVWTSGKESP